jgi:hypothetical protein
VRILALPDVRNLVFSMKRKLLESSAAAPSNETRIAQAPVAERVATMGLRRKLATAWNGVRSLLSSLGTA